MNSDRILDALGDGTRRRIFDMIRVQPLGVAEITDRVPVSQPAVSQHLRVLREAGLADVEKQGRRRIYRARPAGVEPLREYLSAFWDGALEAYEASFEDHG